ncbi:hypothetical protein CGSMWGv00703Bmash_00814 [Gardnerella pickettii 00703Bmash]|nr:hypothetical protein CGSMWGv00703Bmash_00814 [Gardnerella pickettii 00703Bmash]
MPATAAGLSTPRSGYKKRSDSRLWRGCYRSA